jgi:hypothetical protein
LKNEAGQGSVISLHFFQKQNAGTEYNGRKFMQALKYRVDNLTYDTCFMLISSKCSLDIRFNLLLALILPLVTAIVNLVVDPIVRIELSKLPAS